MSTNGPQQTVQESSIVVAERLRCSRKGFPQPCRKVREEQEGIGGRADSFGDVRYGLMVRPHQSFESLHPRAFLGGPAFVFAPPSPDFLADSAALNVLDVVLGSSTLVRDHLPLDQGKLLGWQSFL